MEVGKHIRFGSMAKPGHFDPKSVWIKLDTLNEIHPDWYPLLRVEFIGHETTKYYKFLMRGWKNG